MISATPGTAEWFLDYWTRFRAHLYRVSPGINWFPEAKEQDSYRYSDHSCMKLVCRVDVARSVVGFDFEVYDWEDGDYELDAEGFEVWVPEVIPYRQFASEAVRRLEGKMNVGFRHEYNPEALYDLVHGCELNADFRDVKDLERQFDWFSGVGYWRMRRLDAEIDALMVRS